MPSVLPGRSGDTFHHAAGWTALLVAVLSLLVFLQSIPVLVGPMTAQLVRFSNRPELIEAHFFQTDAGRSKRFEKLDAIVQDFTVQQALDCSLTLSAAAQVTVGPVYDTAGFGDDPPVQAHSVPVDMGDALLDSRPMHAVCLRLSHTPGAPRRPASDLGQHESEVLASLPVEDVRKSPRNLWTGACNPIAADPRFVGGQNE